MEFNHKSVLLDECIENLKIKPDGIYVDGTLGGAGHSLEIAKRLTTGKLIAFDQDQDAIEYAKEVLKEHAQKVILIHSNFEHLKAELTKAGISKIDGLLLDLGVSSYQLDQAERGFSYKQDAPLDMRMDKTRSFSAYDVVNTYSLEELSRVIKEYGEENWHKRIAEFIVEKRKDKPIQTTFELVDIIKAAVPKAARDESLHPAKRTFQAIRVEVNGELEVIDRTIRDAFSMMNKNAVAAVITFHSLEDRIVKNCFKELASACSCPPDFPVCVCDKVPSAKLINKKPIVASSQELEDNPRSRSAKLRCAMRI